MILNQNIADLPLRDIHLPDAISWWPLAPGWWLAFVIMVLCFISIFLLIKKLIKPNLKKEAWKTFQTIEVSFRENGDSSQCLSEISVFLRRVMLSREQPSKIAGVTGSAWLEMLDQSLDQPEFSQGIGQILLTGPYRDHVEHTDVSELLLLCRKWIKGL